MNKYLFKKIYENLVRKSRVKWEDNIFKVIKKKNDLPRILYLGMLSFKKEGKVKIHMIESSHLQKKKYFQKYMMKGSLSGSVG